MEVKEDTPDMFFGTEFQHVEPFRTQLLKWIGNKQRFAHEIASYFPKDIQSYHEPFLGSGAVLAALQHPKSFGSDVLVPLVEIWTTLVSDPRKLVQWYSERYKEYFDYGKPDGYERIKARYNAHPNGADFLFLCRSCYGGVVRFRKVDGYMSTPCGPHKPITPLSFSGRVDVWYRRTFGTQFDMLDYRDAMARAKKGDLIYCDPPYTHSQAILYQGQSFKLSCLFDQILLCKRRGVRVALSIDGTKKSGQVKCELDIPEGLFEREYFVNCGKSMLRRLQREGETLEDEVVHDRLLLTY